MNEAEATVCHCAVSPPRKAPSPPAVVRKAARSLPSLFLGVLLAFFPKCPVCWAAYMSLFGSVWLARTPYAAWLFPALLSVSALHLLFLLRKSRQKGYAPFLLSLTGIVLVLTGRGLFPEQRWILFAAVPLMLAGSLLNSFRTSPPAGAAPVRERL